MAFIGDLDTGLPHLDRAIELHDSRKHNSTRFRLGPSTGVVARVASGLILWQCGALDKAVRRLGEALVIARELDHPYSIAFALYHNGFLAMWRNQFEECREHARELALVAIENDYLVWKTLATVLEGVALTALGQTDKGLADEGLALTETGIELYQGLTTPPVFWPLILTLRATVHALAGKPERALELVNEAIEIGAPDELVSPDFRILRGDFIRMLPEPDLAAAEAAYQAAIRGAKATNLHLIELHALTKLVALRREMGLPDGGGDLATLYATFTEGFDEIQLKVARQLLAI
jgi:tetratricopeptide (TPR) repeat protein